MVKPLSGIKDGGQGATYAVLMNYPSSTRQFLLWLWLSGLTVMAALLAEQNLSLRHGVLAPLVLLLAGIKGFTVIEHYMGLRYAPRWLRLLVHGWLLLVTGLLILSFY
ncbi:cytochrome C oxidase subunit IV family protein [Paludibacterium denitrificans]|uniref:Cytochrome C oxidase subunit IV n=1 Tax=Paludibacterium denitrificans TaxID=2675226 RepID=A0A844GAA3_9NEIS|nr:cytochrome C oxidase subunit IV family protein [Paludibacterium denitrificans]MTD32290.1 hypothetical protein [Paludibacterium denitrificans]HJV07732.1 cytochrome C oxidase subunit IV family protein [Chromobacteriaceae bacterium]